MCRITPVYRITPRCRTTPVCRITPRWRIAPVCRITPGCRMANTCVCSGVGVAQAPAQLRPGPSTPIPAKANVSLLGPTRPPLEAPVGKFQPKALKPS